MVNLQGTEYVLQIDTVSSVTTLARPATAVNYRVIACLTSNGMEITIADQTTSNKCDEGWATSQSGEGSWGFSGEGQAVTLTVDEELTKANYQELLELAVNKTMFFMRWTNPTTSVVREGKVRISSYQETAPNADAYTFSATFVGIGKPFIVPTV